MSAHPPAGRKPAARRKDDLPRGADAPVYSPKEYWESLAGSYERSDPAGCSVVLHPGAPRWFNRTIDRLQARAWGRALGRCELGIGARVLDVGCGTGRWLERTREAGMVPVGVDRTPGMLAIAAERLPGCSLAAAEAQRLPFADASFDGVFAVTVLQHIPWAEQARALREMARVLRPGAPLLLFELLRGKGAHVFARPPEDWIELGLEAGIKVDSWFGQEFLVFDRLLQSAALAVRGGAKHGNRGALPRAAAAEGPAAARRIYWLARRFAVRLSIWAEPVAEHLCPRHLATHGVFVFQKPAGEPPDRRESR
jgi:SAM-dependent methyltransferase